MPSFPNAAFLPPPPLSGEGGPYYGVYVGLVTDVQDPQGQGRVRVRLPWTTDGEGEAFEIWARVATLMAGSDRGTWFIPEPNDEVILSFEGGCPWSPIVVGAVWNGVDQPPETMDSQNNIRSITSRSGIRVTFDDSEGAVQFTLETPGGQKVVCADTPASLELSDSNGNQITLDASGITLNSSATVTINATLLKVSSSLVTVDAGMSKFSGVVQSDTNITNTTVSATYTPGAGNIW
ncbi:MAG: type IV secretion protein Rhs [Leptolyngbya sp. DLM2.Bin15]|nr:MAG: type IV secretion protein Rhs [Leptolyngbya sp. DLM2.Bin15]